MYKVEKSARELRIKFRKGLALTILGVVALAAFLPLLEMLTHSESWQTLSLERKFIVGALFPLSTFLFFRILGQNLSFHFVPSSMHYELDIKSPKLSIRRSGKLDNNAAIYLRPSPSGGRRFRCQLQFTIAGREVNIPLGTRFETKEESKLQAEEWCRYFKIQRIF
jgi:hypothetical protein